MGVQCDIQAARLGGACVAGLGGTGDGWRRYLALARCGCANLRCALARARNLEARLHARMVGKCGEGVSYLHAMKGGEMTGLERLIAAMVRAGWSDDYIAGTLDISAGLVRAICLRFGVPRGERPRKLHVYLQRQQAAEIANDLRLDGWRAERIATALGVSRRTVYRLLRQEVKDGMRQTYSAATRQRKADYMRGLQPLGVEASRAKMTRRWKDE